MPSNGGFAFGPFQLDTKSKRLLRDGAVVPLPARQFALLHVLVFNAGKIVTKDILIQTAWPDVTVLENSLVQAISQLRSALNATDPNRYIQTVSGHGYRFVEPVTHVDVRQAEPDIDALLKPQEFWYDGRAVLETLECAGIPGARKTMADLVRRFPNEPAFHVGLANACVLTFESTRTSLTRDIASLREAEVHAREAIRLNPDYGEAWATLGFILHRMGRHDAALWALRHSVTLEPDSWCHNLRLGAVTFGEELLRATRRALAHMRNCPFAYFLGSTVYVARGLPETAERTLAPGLAAMAAAGGTPTRFSAVGLYLLKGLLCLARGAVEEALDALRRELALEPRGHLYTVEACANAWYVIGACYLHRGDKAAARTAFEEALKRVPAHPMALSGLAILEHGGDAASRVLSDAPLTMNTAMARAALLVAAGNPSGAAQIVGAALAVAPPDNTGWIIPIEPLLRVQDAPDAWAAVLAQLEQRAM